MKIGYYLAKNSKGVILAGLLSVFLAINSASATQQDLQAELTKLANAVASLSSATEAERAQGIEVINALTQASAAPLTVTVGTAAGWQGKSADFPIFYKAGDKPISGVQFDISNSVGVSVTGAVAGIATLAAGKGIQVGQIPGGLRIIIFGLNVTSIPSGPIAIVHVAIAQNAQTGKRIIALTQTVATGPAGVSVSVSSKPGFVTVR